MNQAQGNKKLMDGYVGVKFRAIQCSEEVPSETSGFYTLFKRICDRLKVHDMTLEKVFIYIKHRQFITKALCGDGIGGTGTQGSGSSDDTYLTRHNSLPFAIMMSF